MVLSHKQDQWRHFYKVGTSLQNRTEQNEGTNGLKIKRPVSEPKESWLLQSPPQITGKNRHYWAQNFNNDHKKINLMICTITDQFQNQGYHC